MEQVLFPSIPENSAWYPLPILSSDIGRRNHAEFSPNSSAMSKEASFKINYLHQLLKEEGYLPKIDDDGDLVFKSEGKFLFIFADSNDQEFVRISLPNFWSIDSEPEREVAMKVCCEANQKVKAAKIFLVGDSVWASVELFASPIQSIHDVIGRCITVLHLASVEFCQGMTDFIRQQNCNYEEKNEGGIDDLK
jgi:hypothetical protein